MSEKQQFWILLGIFIASIVLLAYALTHFGQLQL